MILLSGHAPVKAFAIGEAGRAAVCERLALTAKLRRAALPAASGPGRQQRSKLLKKKRRETRKKTLKNHAPEVHSSNRMIFRALAVFCFFGSRPPFS